MFLDFPKGELLERDKDPYAIKAKMDCGTWMRMR